MHNAPSSFVDCEPHAVPPDCYAAHWTDLRTDSTSDAVICHSVECSYINSSLGMFYHISKLLFSAKIFKLSFFPRFTHFLTYCPADMDNATNI